MPETKPNQTSCNFNPKQKRFSKKKKQQTDQCCAVCQCPEARLLESNPYTEQEPKKKN